MPLLVVATARPELLERRPGWGGGKLNATTLALSPLSDEQTAELIARPPRPPAARRRVAADAARARRRQSALRGAVRRAVRRAGLDRRARRCPRRSRASSPPASTGSPSPRRACSRTLPSSARCSGRARSAATRTPRPRRSTRSSARASCAASAARHSKGRASSRSRTRSSATSRTARSRAPTARSGIEPSPSGSTASAARRTTPRCSRTTGARRSSSCGRRVATTTSIVERTRLALRAAGRSRVRAQQLRRSPPRSTTMRSPSGRTTIRAPRAPVPASTSRSTRGVRRGASAGRPRGGTRRAARRRRHPSARPRPSRTSHACSGTGVSNDAVGQHLARAEELAGESVSPRRRESSRSPDEFARSPARTEEGSDASPRRPSPWRPSSGSTSCAPMRSTTIGMVEERRRAIGSGIPDMEQALEIALAADSPVAAIDHQQPRRLRNVRGRVSARWPSCIPEAAATRRALRGRGERPLHSGQPGVDRLHPRTLGRALEQADAFIAECEAGSPHTNETLVREVRAADLPRSQGRMRTALRRPARAYELMIADRGSFHRIGALALLAATYAELGRDEARISPCRFRRLVRETGLHGATDPPRPLRGRTRRR